MIRRSHSSASLLRLLILMLCAATLTFLWGLHVTQKAASRQDALAAKAAEHLNLASIVAETLRQLVDRAQAVGRVTQEDMKTLREGSLSLARLLAEDPVFKRMSLYDRQGRLLSASHSDEPVQLPADWLQQLKVHVAHYGFKPFLPRVAPAASPGSLTNWRLPFLLPLTDLPGREIDNILVVQLDIGYLAVLFQHIDLGKGGSMRLIQDHGAERLRIDNSGVVVAGDRFEPDMPDAGEVTGQLTQYTSGVPYQSLYRRVPERGFSVMVSQRHDEILAPSALAYSRQFWLNLSMTLMILASLAWTLRLLRKRQEAFTALEHAQQVNQQLIGRLEDEHRRSSHAAATDHLSGLHNRRQFVEIAGQALTRQRGKRRLMAILFIDMDRFKSINDSLGHKIGDLLLQAVAGRIQRLLEPGDEASRFGGDEFVVLLAGERSEEQINSWVRTLVQKLSATYALDGQEVNTSPSVGVSICPRDGQDIDSLIRSADAAMYSAKQAGRAQYRFFDPSLNLADIQAFTLEQAFGTALTERQFVLHYQPQIRLDSHRVLGYEALVRWDHPDFGLLYPDRFISLAERSGFIIELGWEVLRLACEALACWGTQGRETCLAVNVSAMQLRQADFSTRLLATLQRHGISPQRLELEITETTILDPEGTAVDHLHRLRAAGLGISLDDFGRGYAGFAHLQALPLSKLKIDRSLIAPLSNSYDDSPIVSSTIILAKRLGLEVVAEGVETREQVVCLKLAGCDIAQGYHFSRPMSLAQLRDYPPFNELQTLSFTTPGAMA
ncbi:putative bifunctional diguanylate cyclase/phosphodiesterase [Pseudomonas vlassakiae]|uniref:putative bifunctional diguanylate cyclase/phosphodiesterase n=1 Tax=Pseudomonas TaxID=286 RepID=UPI000C176066|nr:MULTISPECIES: EAL domain-containing protein [unclassified Pseudomonas]AXQ48264.1 bifunctional diguanylate cyclase/phosphodiesterase [Stenotrophomonas rhizophila]MBS3185272.1 EAL domain-containing protein [Pseudomonas sp. PCH44]PIK77571.1 GGDEF-domain containing protein [Pseudomonas sp. 382]